MSSPLLVVDEKLFGRVSLRLDAIVRNREHLAPLVDMIVRPARLLRLMARETLGALGNDVLAAERLRLLLLGASAETALPALARAALEKMPGEPRHGPGLVSNGSLALVGLAASCVAADGSASAAFLQTVHGLALEAAPLELLARLEPYGVDNEEELEAILRLLVPRYSLSGGERDFLGQVLRDPLERGRWQCLERLFVDHASLFAPRAGWEVTSSDEITGVIGADAAPGQPLELRGNFAFLRNRGRKKWPSSVVVVFASAADPAGVVAKVNDFDPGSIRLTVPAGARPGWIGFDRPDRHERSDRLRAEVIAELGGLQDACLVGKPVPVGLVPAFELAGQPRLPRGIPPRTPRNEYEGPTVSEEASHRVGSGESTRTARGSEPPRDRGRDDVDVDVTPGVGASGLLTPSTAAGPGDRRAGLASRDGSLDLVVFRPYVLRGEHGDDFQQASMSELRRTLSGLEERIGRRIHLVELPWVDDPLMVIATNLGTCEDPRTDSMLEHLSRAAARAPLYEHAIFLLLLPGEGSFRAHTAAEAARAVAIATLETLSQVVSEILSENSALRSYRPVRMFSFGGSAVAPIVGLGTSHCMSDSGLRPGITRLRLVGRLLAEDRIELEHPREEMDRSAGPGAPIESPVVAVAIDASGAELSQTGLKVFRHGYPAHFVSLLPLSPDVTTVEIRRNHRVLQRLVRDPCRPEILAASLADEVLTYAYTYSGASKIEAQVEVTGDHDNREGSGEPDPRTWVPFVRLEDTCVGQAELPFHRLAGIAGLRLVLSDGWNVAAKEVILGEGDDIAFGPVVARRVHDRLLWADYQDSERLARWESDRVKPRVPGTRRFDIEAGEGDIRLVLGPLPPEPEPGPEEGPILFLAPASDERNHDGEPGEEVRVLGDNRLVFRIGKRRGSLHIGVSTKASEEPPAGEGDQPLPKPRFKATAARPFLVVDPPHVASFEPREASVGQRVTIVGEGFERVTWVKFAGVDAEFEAESGQQISAVVPIAARGGPIEVGGGFSQERFEVKSRGAARVAGLSRGRGSPGASFRVLGEGFDGTTQVSVNGVVARFELENASSLRVHVPEGAQSGPIQVTNSAGSATSEQIFTVLDPPRIDSFQRKANGSAPQDRLTPGDLLLVKGSGFRGVTSVCFGSEAEAGFVLLEPEVGGDPQRDDKEMEVTVPAGAAAAGRITLDGIEQENAGFVLGDAAIPRPLITSFTPTSGPRGTQVTLMGSGFTALEKVTLVRLVDVRTRVGGGVNGNDVV